MSQNTGTLNLRVARIESVTPEIKRFTLVSPTGEHLPAFSGGSHVVVLIANDRNTLRNPYSLLSSPYDTSSYQIAVRRVESGRGGSVALHDSVNEGDLIEVTPPVNLFPLIKQARLHLFIAGGVGITVLSTMIEDLCLQKKSNSVTVIHCVASRAHGAYTSELEAMLPNGHFHLVCDDRELLSRLIVESVREGTHVYLCAGVSLMKDAEEHLAKCRVPRANIHINSFRPTMSVTKTAVRDQSRTRSL